MRNHARCASGIWVYRYWEEHVYSKFKPLETSKATACQISSFAVVLVFRGPPLAWKFSFHHVVSVFSSWKNDFTDFLIPLKLMADQDAVLWSVVSIHYYLLSFDKYWAAICCSQFFKVETFPRNGSMCTYLITQRTVLVKSMQMESPQLWMRTGEPKCSTWDYHNLNKACLSWNNVSNSSHLFMHIVGPLLTMLTSDLHWPACRHWVLVSLAFIFIRFLD
jgi:hypothetical protein